MVAQAGQRRAGGDPEARLDHAAEHHSEPERTRRVGHAHGLADAARLGELDVDAVRDRRARGDVGECVAVLVDVHGNRRRLLQLRAVRITRPQRLLAILDTQLRQPGQGVERLLERPVLVHVGLQRDVGDLAHRADPVDIQAVTASELQLQPAEAPARVCLRGLCGHVARSGEPDRPRRRRPEPLEPEEAPDRLAHELPAEVVQRRVDRRARGELLVRQSPHHLFERERVVAEVGRNGLHVGQRRRRGLVVTVDRRRLPEAGHPVVADLDLDHVCRVLRPARDREGFGQLERDDPGADFHAGTLRRSAPVAQGIERAPPEREVAGSIPARRILRLFAGVPDDWPGPPLFTSCGHHDTAPLRQRSPARGSNTSPAGAR